jgi:hypothetical protein
MQRVWIYDDTGMEKVKGVSFNLKEPQSILLGRRP